MEIESLRRKQITNKVNVTELGEKLRQKNKQAGGVSEVEFNNLRESIRKSEERIKRSDTELQTLAKQRVKLEKLEGFLSQAIKNYNDKNNEKERELIELNAEIDEKRKNVDELNRHARKVKKIVPIGAILSSNKVNNDFESSKDELSALRTKLNSLIVQHKALVESN